MEKTAEKTQSALIVINPVAGFMNLQMMRRQITNYFTKAGWTTQMLCTEKDMDLSAAVNERLALGVDLVVVAGGDGTIASTAAGMVGSEVPLGIIPAGTWNAIARHLTLPFNPLRALALMTGKHRERYLDLMSLGTCVHAMNLSVGFSARMIKNTPREKKRKFGNLAYYKELLKQAFGIRLNRYEIEADGMKYHGKALEIMVANYGVVGLNLLEAPLEIHPDDGKVDVLIFKPRTILDLPVMFWQALIKRQKRGPKFQQLQASSTLIIRTTPPMEVQSDGESLGITPVSIEVLQRSVKVIVP